jgi:diaminopimelate decarboxylase
MLVAEPEIVGGTDRIDRFLAEGRPPTPCLVDLDIVRAQYQALRGLFADATVFYAVKANPAPEVVERAILAGCTCDSADVIYPHSDYRLPLGLAVGDPIDFLSVGACTASYASVEFNGFPPIRTYCI